MVLTPEVDTAKESGPRWGAGIPVVRFDQVGVGSPHHLLQLPELTQEAGVTVVDLLGIFGHHRVSIGLNIPNTIGESAAAGASNFLLLISPVRELDLVGEENTASHNVNKLELRLDGADSRLGLLALRQALNNLNLEQIVRVTSKSFVTVGRDLELPVSLGNRRTLVVRVNTAVSKFVVESDHRAILNGTSSLVVPSKGTLNLAVGAQGLSLVLHNEDVVLILVRVKGDLLLLTTGGVHVVVRVQVATLGVVVTEGDTRAERHISRNILHALGIQGVLELGRHETITLARVDQADEVNSEHGKVESQRNHDQTEDTREQVLEPQSRGHSTSITEQHPELESSERSHPSHGEEANPLDAECSAQREASGNQPKPPGTLEGMGRTHFLLVGEAAEGERSQSSKEDQRRVQKNQSGLGSQCVV